MEPTEPIDLENLKTLHKQSRRGGLHRTAFVNEIQRIAKLAGIPRDGDEYWNQVIDWLDARHPGWNGHDRTCPDMSGHVHSKRNNQPKIKEGTVRNLRYKKGKKVVLGANQVQDCPLSDENTQA